MTTLHNSKQLLLATAGARTYARYPVRSDSARKPVRFEPLAPNRTEHRRQCARLYHDARRFERATRAPGRQDGALGRNGLAILHAMLFDFLNARTGQLDPSYETIARAANISIRSVARGLQKLRAARVLNWVRRCFEDIVDGRYVLKQDTNAYAVAPATQWNGYRPAPPPPPPEAGTWGDHPPVPSVREMVLEAAGNRAAMIRALELDPNDKLAAVSARLLRSLRS